VGEEPGQKSWRAITAEFDEDEKALRGLVSSQDEIEKSQSGFHVDRYSITPRGSPKWAVRNWRAEIKKLEASGAKDGAVRAVIRAKVRDLEHFRFFIAWLAQLVQQPHIKPGTNIVLKGKEGVGKSKVGEWVVALFGRNAMVVSEALWRPNPPRRALPARRRRSARLNALSRAGARGQVGCPARPAVHQCLVECLKRASTKAAKNTRPGIRYGWRMR
jgi:hypothetical protein